MKVLDLRCAAGHGFEGWFGSEDDFQNQLAARRIECPFCGDADVHKRLSAPRLNLGSPAPAVEVAASPAAPLAVANDGLRQKLQAAWLTAARQVIAQTDDVGTRFADEARRMHYGEAPERAIRGQATRQQAADLVEEGIAVAPLALPAALEGPLH